MNRFMRLLICLLFLGINLYCYIDMTNRQTQMRLELPKYEKAIEMLSQQNIQLKYELENFNNPQHLLELAKQPEYSHLKFPFMEEVLVISSEIAKKHEPYRDEIDQSQNASYAKWPVYLGIKK
jgi:hypothetical protein